MFRALKNEIESLLGVKVYPLTGPQTESEFITLQLISDPDIETGMLRTRLIAARYQVSFVSSRYSRATEMDNILWSVWADVVHGHIGGYPVQYVERAGVSEHFYGDDGGKYRRARDYIFYCEGGRHDPNRS